MQVGYCGLDGQPEHGAMPGAPVNGDSSLDIDVYCKGYVAWDFTAMLLQVCQLMPAHFVYNVQSSCTLGVHVAILNLGIDTVIVVVPALQAAGSSFRLVCSDAENNLNSSPLGCSHLIDFASGRSTEAADIYRAEVL